MLRRGVETEVLRVPAQVRDDGDKGLVLSLFDYTGIMVEPWLDAGYRCMIVDSQHPAGAKESGLLTQVGADITAWLPPLDYYAMVFAFPPCTHLAKGGARYYRDKGLKALIEGLVLVERARELCEWSAAPWMLENPVGSLSKYWREPNDIVHPYEFAGWLDDPAQEAYSKQTCLWWGNGFVRPVKNPVSPLHGDRTSSFGSSKNRQNLRSMTPAGLARAVFEANHEEC